MLRPVQDFCLPRAMQRALAALLMMAATSSSLYAASEQQGLPVEAQVVKPQRIERQFEAVGSLTPNESVVVSPEVAGRISEIHFAEGQAVSAGDVLFSLDSSIERAQLKQAEASRELSQLEYRRANELLRKNVGSANDRDAALAKLRTDEAEVELARERINKMSLVAPFDGVMGLRQVSLGQYVSPGESLAPLVSVNPIKLEFQVPEIYVSDIQRDQSVAITLDAMPGQRFTGQVYALSPAIDDNSRNFTVRARLNNDEGQLKPGLFARVTVTLETIPDALMVAEDALVPEGHQQLVYKLVDGKVEITPVEIGLRRLGQVRIVKGVAPGDIVVTAGQMKLQPGAAAVPINLPASADTQ